MHDTNNFHLEDDSQHIEISDLPSRNLPADKEIPPLTVKHLSLTSRYSLRQRRKQAMVTACLILAALLAILGSSLQIRGLLATTLFGVTAPTQLKGANYFYLPTLPSWGTFSLDAHPLATTSSASDNTQPVKIAAGLHQLEWHGAPFQTLHCVLAVPPDPPQQSCNVRLNGPDGYTQNAYSIAFPLSLSLNQLPESQRVALIQTTQDLLNTLQSSTTVQPGERYMYNQSTSSANIASGLLSAHIHFLLDTDTSAPAHCTGLRFGPLCSFAGEDCRNFCTLAWPQTGNVAENDGWHVAAILRPTWTYTSLTQQVTVPPALVDNKGDQNFVMLHITWQHGQWHVTFHQQGASSFDDPNCISTIGSIMAEPMYSETAQSQQRITWTFSSAANRATGCLATATLHTGNDLRTSTSITPDAYVLQRFGFLLAANDVAHRLWPSLPVASIYDQGIAQDIAQHAVFVS